MYATLARACLPPSSSGRCTRLSGPSRVAAELTTVSRLVAYLVRLFVRCVPDAFVVALLLSALTFLLSVTVGGYPVVATLESWGDSFWNLLTFTNQITLTLLLGYVLANTPPMRAALLRLAGTVRTPTGAYALACLITGVCALLSWGLGLISAGIMARNIGEACRRRGTPIHYPLLVAASFSGFVIWHQGLTSSIAATMATSGHFLEEQIGLVPISETLLTPWNIGVAMAILGTMPFLMAALRPRASGEIEEIPDRLLSVEESVQPGDAPASRTLAQRLEDSRLLSLLTVSAGAIFLWTHFVVRRGGLDLNTLNFGFLLLGMLLAGSPRRYMGIVLEGGRVVVPFLLQYPLYAGIAGMMADSGLARMVVELFVSISSAETLPSFVFLSSGLLNFFIPSGGGQWAVQGPIVIAAAQGIGADLTRVAMAVALGDQWTNLIQPLALIPVLTIAGISLRKVVGYTFIALLWSGTVFVVALIFF